MRLHWYTLEEIKNETDRKALIAMGLMMWANCSLEKPPEYFGHAMVVDKCECKLTDARYLQADTDTRLWASPTPDQVRIQALQAVKAHMEEFRYDLEYNECHPLYIQVCNALKVSGVDAGDVESVK